MLKKSGTSNRKESWPLSVFISTKPTSAPIALSAITISLFSEVGYNQSEVKEMMKNFVLVSLNALERFPPYCLVKSK